jgi:hypothetical protein
MKTRIALVVALSLMVFGAISNAEPPTTPATDTTTTTTNAPADPNADPAGAQREAKRQADAKAAAKKAEAQKAADDKAAADKAAADKVAADKAAAQKAADDKAAADKAAAARVAAERAAAAKVAAEKAAAEAAVASERRWLLRLAIASTALSLIAVVLLAVSLLRRKSRPKPEEIELARRLNATSSKLDAALQLLDDRVQKNSDAIAARLAAASLVTPDHLSPIAADVARAREDLARLGQNLEEFATRPTPAAAPATDQVALERQVLNEWWKLFRSNNELSSAFDSAAQDSTWVPLVKELARVVPAELKPTFDAVIAPCEEHWSLIQKIGLVPRLASGEAGMLATPAEEVRRTREFAGLLQTTQSSGNAPGRLSFRFKNWVTDHFLAFADLYLQRYQQARLENRDGELQKGVTLVLQLLRIAAVEPIGVTPGETRFDSTRHIGRSTSNDPRFADGVITGVVRNGFVEGGQQVIRQPEVIVNRMR